MTHIPANNINKSVLSKSKLYMLTNSSYSDILKDQQAQGDHQVDQERMGKMVRMVDQVQKETRDHLVQLVRLDQRDQQERQAQLDQEDPQDQGDLKAPRDLRYVCFCNYFKSKLRQIICQNFGNFDEVISNKSGFNIFPYQETI